MWKLLDLLFLWLHIIIIAFNIFGWIWSKTRKWHFWLMIVTIFSWLVLGLKYGLGYCFLTDWHWDVKRRLGETGMPASFIKYFLDQYTSINLSTETVDWITAAVFGSVVIITLYINFVYPRLLRKKGKFK